jgi:GxxExxY protein
MLRIPSPFPTDYEEIVTRVIGCCITVHRALGPGLLESIYSRAMCLELTAGGIPFEREREIPVTYRDALLCVQRLDFVVDHKIVLELKSVDRFVPVHRAQLLSYLRISGLKLGLLVHFNVPVLQDGLKRIVL